MDGAVVWNTGVGDAIARGCGCTRVRTCRYAASGKMKWMNLVHGEAPGARPSRAGD